MKRIAIVQSNYVPWKGYFDLMRRVDEFVLYDDVQYTRRDWRNRNRFKAPGGVRWLTIPVQVKGRYLQRIDETVVSEPGWGERHWETLVAWYGRAPFFKHYRPVLEGLYREIKEHRLSAINRGFLGSLRDLLGIATPLTSSLHYPDSARTNETGATRKTGAGSDRRTARLVEICRAAGATCYLSGPAARDYLDEDGFRSAGIEVEWMSYEGYPEYPQLHGPFEHGVSVLDLLFNVGEEAPAYMLGDGAQRRDEVRAS